MFWQILEEKNTFRGREKNVLDMIHNILKMVIKDVFVFPENRKTVKIKEDRSDTPVHSLHFPQKNSMIRNTLRGRRSQTVRVQKVFITSWYRMIDT